MESLEEEWKKARAACQKVDEQEVSNLPYDFYKLCDELFTLYAMSEKGENVSGRIQSVFTTLSKASASFTAKQNTKSTKHAERNANTEKVLGIGSGTADSKRFSEPERVNFGVADEQELVEEDGQQRAESSELDTRQKAEESSLSCQQQDERGMEKPQSDRKEVLELDPNGLQEAEKQQQNEEQKGSGPQQDELVPDEPLQDEALQERNMQDELLSDVIQEGNRQDVDGNSLERLSEHLRQVIEAPNGGKFDPLDTFRSKDPSATGPADKDLSHAQRNDKRRRNSGSIWPGTYGSATGRSKKRLRTTDDDLVNYTDYDSCTGYPVEKIEYRVLQVKTRHHTTNKDITQYWHWVGHPDNFFEHQVLAAIKPISWGVFSAEYDFHLRADEVKEIADLGFDAGWPTAQSPLRRGSEVSWADPAAVDSSIHVRIAEGSCTSASSPKTRGGLSKGLVPKC